MKNISFIWGLNTGEQLIKLITKIHVYMCSCFQGLCHADLLWAAKLQKNAFKGLCATIFCTLPASYPKLQNFLKQCTIIIVGTSCKHPSVSVSSSCWLFVLHSCANKFIIQWVTRTKWNTNSTQNPLKWQHKNTAVANADPTVTNNGRKLILRSFFFLL